MHASSIIVSVLLCGGAFAKAPKEKKRLDPVIQNLCKEIHQVTDEQIHRLLTYQFNDVTANQKEFMLCYVRKTKMIDEAGEIQVKNIPFSTPAKLEACKAKLGPVLSGDHVIALSLCHQDKRLELCEIVEKGQ